MARKWRSGIPASFRVDWAVAVTPIAEAGDFMDVTAELSEEAPPPGVNFWQALHVDGGRVSATMRDERTREMPSFIGEARIMVHDEGKYRPALRRYQACSPMLALARPPIARKGDY
jgi:hypothetical protein